MPKAIKQVLRRLRAHQPTHRRRQFELRPVHQHETRILPTAIVTFTGTALTITGDTGDNNITVENVGGQLHIDANGGLITVAGSDVPDFFFNLTGAFNLNATFQVGDDALEVLGPLQLKSANVKMGDALTSDVVSFTDVRLSGKLTIDTNSGADLVILTGTTVTGTTLIDTGWNDDGVSIVECTFTGPTTIKTDIGFDSLSILGGGSRTKFVGKLTITTGDDTDSLSMGFIDSKAISIDTGDSSDSVALGDFLIAGGLTVKTGAGSDTFNIGGIIQSGTGANLFDFGSDSDLALLQECSFSGATTVNLGSGMGNVLAIDDVSFNNLRSIHRELPTSSRLNRAAQSV